MRARLFNSFGAFAVLAIAAAGLSAPAGAADMALKVAPHAAGDIVLACENGRNYPLYPIAVTVTGELVTATLRTSPNHAAYVRLVPMGVGYRYAGKGIWVDGLRDNAQISFGHRAPVACTVEQS